jgi:8-oxo-dGTP pyrophosphatase MutT (NUDIX family)
MLQERSAGLVIFRIEDDGPKFLLLNYGRRHWDFPKGNIEEKESKKDAAIREAEEETGISSFRFIDEFKQTIEYFYKIRGDTVHKEVVYFLAETDKKEVTLSYEHKGYKWLSFDRAMEQLSFKNSKRILEKAHKTIEQMS